jgi:NAD(P)-dependent dehydrogenase (short-subunit alcohol dehydrogenase family)
VAGASGNLGGRIVRELLERGASVRALVRQSTPQHNLERLHEAGVTVVKVDYSRVHALIEACSQASCVVSALQGLRDVVVETQAVLLDAAIKAQVPRFFPSDFSIDFTKLPPGENRNLDLRREFLRTRNELLRNLNKDKEAEHLGSRLRAENSSGERQYVNSAPFSARYTFRRLSGRKALLRQGGLATN